MLKCRSAVVAFIAALPIAATAGAWHLVPDEVNPGVPITNGFVIGAIQVDSIKVDGDHVNAQVAMFYAYDLTEAALDKLRVMTSDLRPKVKAAFEAGRGNAYLGTEHAFTGKGANFSGSNEDIRVLLVASEILVEEGFKPIATRTVQVQCRSKLDFSYRYEGSSNWGMVGFPRDGSASRGSMLPFMCDKVGMGQNPPAPPPPPDADMVQLQQIHDGVFLPRWKFLGVKDGQYGRSFVFFGADTIKKKPMYTDVVVGYWNAESRSGLSPENFISDVQEGKNSRQGNYAITHIHCDTENMDENYSGAKLFETQLVAYVCANRH